MSQSLSPGSPMSFSPVCKILHLIKCVAPRLPETHLVWVLWLKITSHQGNGLYTDKTSSVLVLVFTLKLLTERKMHITKLIFWKSAVTCQLTDIVLDIGCFPGSLCLFKTLVKRKYELYELVREKQHANPAFFSPSESFVNRFLELPLSRW